MKSKKIVAVLLAIVLSVSILPLAASAKTTTPTSSSSSIVYQIKVAVVQALVDKANQKIADLVKKAQATRVNDVPQLLAATNLIAQTTIKAAASLGVTVVCVYVTYKVDGQLVAIDPLKVAY